ATICARRDRKRRLDEPVSPNRQGRTGLPLGKRHLAVFLRDMNRVAGGEIAGEDLPSQRILDLLLDCALERPRAIDRIESDLGDGVERFERNIESDVELGKPRLEASELD